jgi:hypothetical protein
MTTRYVCTHSCYWSGGYWAEDDVLELPAPYSPPPGFFQPITQAEAERLKRAKERAEGKDRP